MKKIRLSTLLFTVTLLFAASLSAKNIQYVSDDLTIPMRSGTTNGHKILKFLKSGTPLEIIELTDDEKHALVVPLNDESKTGWVETSLLMTNKSAREQLVLAKKRALAIKEKQAEIKAALAESRSENIKLQNIQSQLESKIKSLQNTLGRLRKNASDPIRIADENEQLKQELTDAESKVAELTEENIILGDENIKSWFLIGGAVSIGSLVFGIMLTRIRWKKNDRWA